VSDQRPPATVTDRPARHVVVCGIEHLGLRTIGELRLRDERVVAIAPTEPAVDQAALDGVEIVIGDTHHEATLRHAGVDRALAIVLTSDDDRTNLDVALAAQELNPGIRIVIRMFDADLGEHLSQLFPDAVVLSSSALAAPAFVSAALDGEGGERFLVGGRLLSTRLAGDALPTSTDASVAPLAAPIARIPIARLRPDRTVDILPDASPDEAGVITVDVHPLRPDELAHARSAFGVIGAAAGRITSVGSTAGSSMLERLRSLPGSLRARVSRPERRLVRFAAALVILAAVSALYFEVTAGLSPLDALSYAITLLTGASLLTSIDPSRASAALKIYAIFLSIVGAAIVAVVYALITDAIIRSRLLQTLGRRTVPASIRDHVIVCGLGSIGYRVVQGLVARGTTMVAVEANEEGRFVAAARAIGVPVVIGDARQRELLQQLGLATARALVAATSDDLVNLSATLNARRLRPDLRVVVRLFDPAFAVRVQRGFGIRFTRSVSHLAAPAFAAAAIGTEVVGAIPVGDRRVVLLARIRASAGSGIVGQTVRALAHPGERRIVAVMAGHDDDGIADWAPDPARPTHVGDELIVLATRKGLADMHDSPRETGATVGAS
jgi:Trk K+ transport system NAD-binding subunit